MEPRVHAPLVALCQHRERRDQILIMEAAVGASGFGEGVRKPHQ